MSKANVTIVDPSTHSTSLSCIVVVVVNELDIKRPGTEVTIKVARP